MKQKLETLICWTAIITVLLCLAFVVAQPAHASGSNCKGNGHGHCCKHGNCNDDDDGSSSSTSTSSAVAYNFGSNDKLGDRLRDTATGVALTCLVAPGVVSHVVVPAYRFITGDGWRNGTYRVCFVWEVGPKNTPVPSREESAIVPANAKDTGPLYPKQTLIIEAR